jgi:hypothetical protein
VLQSILALHAPVAVMRLLQKMYRKYDTTEGHVIPVAFHEQMTAACNTLGNNLGAKDSAAMTEVDVREVTNMKSLSQSVQW